MPIRLNRSVHSYATDPIYSRKSDAKYTVATLAIEMGPLHFSTHGDPGALEYKRGLVFASIGSLEHIRAGSDQLSIQTAMMRLRKSRLLDGSLTSNIIPFS